MKKVDTIVVTATLWGAYTPTIDNPNSSCLHDITTGQSYKFNELLNDGYHIINTSVWRDSNQERMVLFVFEREHNSELITE